MSDSAAILEQLRENNPFISSSSPSPFENKNSDLAQLNSSTSEEIEQLLLHKRRDPEMPIGGLILGEPGAGKTHMLARILRRLRDNARPMIFAAVKTAKAFTSPKTITQDIWSEILLSLEQAHSGGHSQFDMLLSRMMDSYREHREDDGFTDLTKLDRRVYLMKDMRGINKDFLKCILLYMGTSDDMTRLQLFEWLRDGLDDEESLSLGLPLRNPHAMDDAECEGTARKFMLSLGYMLSYAKVSMVVCFDQFEPIRDKALIHVFGDTISFMMNDISGMIPLCFSRADLWNDLLRPELDTSAVQRLEHHKMTMKSCSPAQARQLVKSRLAASFTEGVEEKYKWLVSRMDNVLVSDCSPRMVIKLADHIIMTSGTTTDDEEIISTLRNIYDTERSRIIDKPAAWLPNPVHLASALKVWLESHDGFETAPGDGKYIMLKGTFMDKRYAFPIITAKNYSTAAAGIKRGVQFLKEYSDGVCFYITESRTHKASWKKFVEQQEIFEPLGGKVVILDNNTRADWYALTALVNQIAGGDVDLYLSSGNRAATIDDLYEFAASLELLPGIFSDVAPKQTEPAVPPQVPVIEPDILKVNLMSIIKSSPMKLLTTDKAINALERRKIRVTRPELMGFLKNSRDSFRTYTSKSGEIMIGLV
ncbi:MAG: ATP-binding protein [Synergistaceae bacterium]|nr:ATP-binding protein [Synergistaceae bacterium]